MQNILSEWHRKITENKTIIRYLEILFISKFHCLIMSRKKLCRGVRILCAAELGYYLIILCCGLGIISRLSRKVSAMKLGYYGFKLFFCSDRAICIKVTEYLQYNKYKLYLVPTFNIFEMF